MIGYNMILHDTFLLPLWGNLSWTQVTHLAALTARMSKVLGNTLSGELYNHVFDFLQESRANIGQHIETFLC